MSPAGSAPFSVRRMAQGDHGDHLRERDRVLQSLDPGWPYANLPINNRTPGSAQTLAPDDVALIPSAPPIPSAPLPQTAPVAETAPVHQAPPAREAPRRTPRARRG